MNVNHTCALQYNIDNWDSIQWSKVINRVNRLQYRIAKAVRENKWGKAKSLMFLATKFSKLGTFIFHQLKKWTKYQHGNKTWSWIFKRYFLLNHFQDRRTTAKGIYSYRLYRIAFIPIIYHVKVKSAANPFLKESEKYFFVRKKWRKDIADKCRQKTTFVKKIS